MAFSTLFFPFVFLPAVLILYFIVPRKAKNLVLLLCSIVFFAWGTPEYVILILCSILFHFFTGKQLAAAQSQGRKGKWILVSAVLVNLLFLGFFKYYPFLVETVNGILGTSITARSLPMPIGISFFTFSVLSYLFDVYYGRTPAAANFIDFSLFVTFFPKLVSGPIVQYHDMALQMKERQITLDKVGTGSRRFLVGLAKKLLLADTLGKTFYAVSGLPLESVTAASAWLGALSYTLMLYLDFSGYSDMAIGLGEMFGFDLGKNFDYPYVSTSITEFWRRWHISLGGWFRDYVYIPLGGSRKGSFRTILNLLIVWALTGIWHGSAWTFVVWGLYYGLLLILEKFVFAGLLKKIPGFIKWIFTFLLVVLGWVFFFSGSLSGAFGWIGRMFGAGGFTDSTAAYYWGGSWLVLLISAFASFPVGSALGSHLIRRGKGGLVLSVIWFAALLMLCIAIMMNSTYSTFLYFQF